MIPIKNKKTFRATSLRQFFVGVALLALPVFFSGCTHQDREGFPTGEEKNLELLFGDNKDNTKAGVLGGTGQFIWEDGDPLSIYFAGSTNSYKSFTVKGEMVNVAGEVDARSRYAVYPSSAIPDSDQFYDTDKPRVTYRSTYSTTGREADSKMPIIAVNDPNSNKLVFYHVGGLLRIKLAGLTTTYKSIKVTFEKTDVTGTYNVDVTDATQPQANSSAIVGSGGKEVVFNLPSEGKAGTCYLNVPLPIGDYSYSGAGENLTITLYTGTDATGDNPVVYDTDINIGNLRRADGRQCGISLTNLTIGVDHVGITTVPANNTLYLNDSPYYYTLTSTVFYNDGSQSSDPGKVEWTSSNSNVVSVDNNGLIIAMSEGTAAITATSKENINVKATVDIVVERNSATGNFVERPFSVSDNHTVVFSPGYLQATLAANQSAEGATWQFAREQYEFIGPEVGNTSTLNAGTTIDLFGWSGNANYGVSTSTNTNDYMGSYADEFYDWGGLEIINRGTSVPAGTYRTPQIFELDYILNKRTGSKAGTVGTATDCRYSIVTVNNVLGILLYPDGFLWNRYSMGEFPTRFNVMSSSCGTYSGNQWINIEKEGGVFLPFAGNRSGNAIGIGTLILNSATLPYKTSQYNLASFCGQRATGGRVIEPMRLGIANGVMNLNADYNSRGEGASVRLIKDNQKPVRYIAIDQAKKSSYKNNLSTIQLDKGVNSLNLTATVYYADGTTSSNNVVFEIVPLSRFSDNSRFGVLVDNAALELSGTNNSTLTKKKVGQAFIRAKLVGSGGYSIYFSQDVVVGLSNGTLLAAADKIVEFSPRVIAEITNYSYGNYTYTYSLAPSYTYVTPFNELSWLYFSNNVYYDRNGKVELFSSTYYNLERGGFTTTASGGNINDDPFASISLSNGTTTYPIGYWRMPTYTEIGFMSSSSVFKDADRQVGWCDIDGVSGDIIEPSGCVEFEFGTSSLNMDLTMAEWQQMKAKGYTFFLYPSEPSYNYDADNFGEFDEVNDYYSWVGSHLFRIKGLGVADIGTMRGYGNGGSGTPSYYAADSHKFASIYLLHDVTP